MKWQLLLQVLVLMGSLSSQTSQAQDPPATGLYFSLGDTVYLPNDTILITSIGRFKEESDPADSGTSLVCHTENVNPRCCRGQDGGNVGEWFLPDGTMVVRNGAVNPESTEHEFTRSGYYQQIRLNRRFPDVLSPIGAFRCEVLDADGNRTYSASIRTIAPDPTPSSGLYFTLSGNIYYSGDTIFITDIGESDPANPRNADNSLVCETRHINSQCCRESDGGNVGEWFFPDGSMVVRNRLSLTIDYEFTRSGYLQQVRLNRKSTSALSPTGTYQCMVPSNGVEYSASITIIQASSFPVMIIASPTSTNFFTGLSLILTCSAQVPKDLRSTPFVVTATWSKARNSEEMPSQIVPDERLKVVGGSDVEGGVYWSTLSFEALNASQGDEGVYGCNMTFKSPGLTKVSDSAEIHLIMPTILIQLILTGVDDCESWREDNPASKDAELMGAIVGGINVRCRCNLTQDRVTERSFHCLPFSPQAVSYRARLHSTLSANVSQLAAKLQEWATTGPAVPAQPLPLTVDSACVVTDESRVEWCSGTAELEIPTVPTTTSELPLIIIVAGASCAVLFLLVLIIVALVLIVVVVAVRNRRSNTESENVPETLRSMNKFAVESEDHEYEEIHSVAVFKSANLCPTSANGEFGLSKCVAYDVCMSRLPMPEVEEPAYAEVGNAVSLSQSAREYELPVDRKKQEHLL